MSKKKIAFLTGAGISANSGIPTYRDVNGLWKNHDFEKVASIEGFKSNPELVLSFYNERMFSMRDVMPTEAHKLIKQLEDDYEVVVITQNVDDLHEKAMSSNVIHYHGELLKLCNSSKTYFEPYDRPILVGDLAPDGTQLRPAIVMFGESIDVDQAEVIGHVLSADYVVIIGTSLEVYPFAEIPSYLDKETKLFYIDKNNSSPSALKGIDAKHICYNVDADTGMKEFIEHLNLN